MKRTVRVYHNKSTPDLFGELDMIDRRYNCRATAWIVLVLLLLPRIARAESKPVKVWEQEVAIPTYAAGEPEPNPIFYFGRASQGAQGRVYPYPLYDSLTNVKTDKTYRMVYLENEYVRIGILPEIGGRLFEAVDKSNNYDFIYHQHVIKPALIGLIGAWISGGIEWNIPHHHRATTFLPVQSKIEENSDGSKTVWVGELELRQRMRWAVGYTLHPDKSYLECSVRIINRTPLPNNMLCFANVAVHANDQYQVIYPPSTQYVTFHGKREFTTWPIATTRFNGADFSRGVDVSWYKNHDSANSMFAWNYEDDFFAGYDHGKEAGIVNVADHHVVPGKKFWTWGNGPRGKMWDKILTDDDGPYIELMVGAYSDNQPDYSWLQPYETKSFQMNWYPIRDIGSVKNANLDAAVNLETSKPDGLTPTKIGRTATAEIGFCTTAAHSKATVSLKLGDKTLLEENVNIDPTKPYLKQVPLPEGVDDHELRASLSADGKELVAYSPIKLAPQPMPEQVSLPPSPKNIKTVEELYLAGQRIEQFQTPGIEPEPYWEEALSRDPGDARVNTALGIRQIRAAKFAEAEQHFRTAIKRLTTNYTSPKDGEPFYYLGVALDSQGKHDEAYDAFFKATWSQAWRGPAYFGISQIDTRRGNFALALDHVNRSLDANDLNVLALNLKAAVLRHLDRPQEALAVLDAAARDTDPLDVDLLTERWRSARQANKTNQTASTLLELKRTIADFPNAALETVVDLGDAGLWEDAFSAVNLITQVAGDEAHVSPLVYYYAAQSAEDRGNTKLATECRERAARHSPEYVFPFQWEAIAALRAAIKSDPNDARAPYYLGNLLFDWQPDEAVKLWEQSAKLDPSFAFVHRNLAAAYAHQKPTPDTAKAIAELEVAVACPQKYALHFAELDELYAAAAAAPEKRLALLEQNHDVVAKRDDALSREIGLKVFAGKYDEAIALMSGRKFAVWEGGSLEVTDHWVNAHLLRGRRELSANQYLAALDDFQAAKNIPDNLPNDRGGAARSAEIAYWIGAAHKSAGDTDLAERAWQDAANMSLSGFRRGPEGRISDRQVQTYFQALSMRQLGKTAEADTALRGLVQLADQALAASNDLAGSPDGIGIGSHPPHTRAALEHYIAGLGHLGLDERQTAKAEFERALQCSPDSLGPSTELARLQSAASK